MTEERVGYIPPMQRRAVLQLRQAEPMEPVRFGWRDFAVLLSTSFAALVMFWALLVLLMSMARP